MSHCGWACVFYSVYGYRYMIVTSIPPSLDVVSMSSFVGIFFFWASFSRKLMSQMFFVLLKTFPWIACVQCQVFDANFLDPQEK